MLCTLLVIAQTAEPAPQGWTATGEAVLRHAETSPVVFFALLAVVLPLAALGLLLVVFFRWGLPAWREEAAKNRTHLAELVAKRGEEAAADIAAARELAKTQHEALVSRIETKVDRVTGEMAKLDGRVERHGEVLARLAAKAGAVVVLLLLLTGCASTLPIQQRLGGYVAASLRACKEDGRRCAAAKLCSHAATDAAEAIQKDRQAQAEGREDAETALRAAALPVAAEAQCGALGFTASAASKAVQP